MKGDFTKLSYDPTKHYSSVRMQQGRVQLDTDWNNQADIQSNLIQTLTADFVGTSAAPQTAGGFAITTSSTTVSVAPGRTYAGGMLSVLEGTSPVPFASQPDYPGAALPTAAGTYLAYLDAWPRHITVVEDPSLLEVALGGADTSTRVKNMAQVKLVLLPLPPTSSSWSSSSPPSSADWAAWTAPSTGMMAAAPVPPPAASTSSAATYAGAENQLYRVEIHSVTGGPAGTGSGISDGTVVWASVAAWKASHSYAVGAFVTSSGNTYVVTAAGTSASAATGGPSGTGTSVTDNSVTWALVPPAPWLSGHAYALSACVTGGGSAYVVTTAGTSAPGNVTFKWSRDNGTVLTLGVLSLVSGSATQMQITLSQPARDDVLGWAVGQWVEISIDANEINPGLPGPSSPVAPPGQPAGTFAQILGISGLVLTITAVTDPRYAPTSTVSPTVKVRRWDSTPTQTFQVSTGASWTSGSLPLENNVSVQFSGAGGQPVFQPGDYWAIPARTITQGVIWPVDVNNNPLPQPPQGIVHAYAQLATVTLTGTTWSFAQNLRATFPSLQQVGLAALQINGNNVTVLGSLATDGSATVGTTSAPQPLTVTGAVTAGPAGSTANNLAVTGAASVSGALSAGSATVTGALSAGSAAVSGAVTTGAVTAGASGSTANNLAVNGAASVTGTLTAGNATVTGAITTGPAKSTATNLTVNGAASVTGAVSAGSFTAGASGSLTVAGAALTVNGAANVTSTLRLNDSTLWFRTSSSATTDTNHGLVYAGNAAASPAAGLATTPTPWNGNTTTPSTNPDGPVLFGYGGGGLGTTNGGNKYALTWTYTGLVGIGTVTPGYPLDVEATTTTSVSGQYGYLNSSGAGSGGSGSGSTTFSAKFAGRVIAQEFDAVSDEREKRVLDHMQPEVALGALRGVDVVRYEWLYRGGLPKWGVLAQQLGPLVPEAVSVMAGKINGEPVEDFHTVDFQQVTAVELAAIQALDARTGALRADNTALAGKVGALETRLRQREDQEAVVCHRGEGRLLGGVATVELPASFEALARPEGRTVQVTPLWDGLSSRCSALAATTVREGRFRVRALDAGDPEQRFYWEVKGVRAETPPPEVER